MAMQFDQQRLLLGDRRLQDPAAYVDVKVVFQIEDGFGQSTFDQARRGFKEYWKDQRRSIRALYISLFALILVSSCSICVGLIFWRRCCSEMASHRPRREDERNDDGSESTEGRSLQPRNPAVTGKRRSATVAQDSHDENSYSEDEQEQRRNMNETMPTVCPKRGR